MRRRCWWGLVFLVALGLGVTNAAGHTNAITLITVQVVGKGTVSSDPSGIKCGVGNTKCYISFTESGGNVTLTADAADNWDFDSWDGPGVPDTDPCGPGNTCSIPEDGNDHVVTANFSKPSGSDTTTLSVSAPFDSDGSGGNVHSHEGNDDGPIDCGSDMTPPPSTTTNGNCHWTVPKNSVLTVRQTPDAGFVFNGWSGSCSGTNIACTVVMDDDHDVGTTWSESGTEQVLTVSISGQGTVTGGGINCTGPAVCTKNEPSGSTIMLHAQPKDGFVLSAWGGSCAGTDNTCTLTMDSDRTATATFVAAPVPLTVNVAGNGNVSGGSGAVNCGNGATICSATFAANATVTLVATPSTGGTFVGWTGACGGTSTACTVLMNQAKSVTATFSGGVERNGIHAHGFRLRDRQRQRGRDQLR